MPVRVGINGFGRIGRTFYRAMREARRRGTDISLVAANDLGSVEEMATLLMFDSVRGRLDVPVHAGQEELLVGDDRFPILRERDPGKLPWADLGVDVVIESTRFFTDRDKAAAHLDAGAPLIVVSAPSDGADATFVVGVNEDTFDANRHKVVSMGSCTTNCLVPMVTVLEDAFGLDCGLMTTVHAYTSDQPVVDGPNKNLRQTRAAAMNIVPTSTGAARATRLVLPETDGKLDGSALRVPVLDGSITDLTAVVRGEPSVEEVNRAFATASREGRLAPVLDYSELPIVSSDIVGSSASCTFDAPLTKVVRQLVKVFGWYDNEWGYSNRLVDLCMAIARPGQSSPPESRL